MSKLIYVFTITILLISCASILRNTPVPNSASTSQNTPSSNSTSTSQNMSSSNTKIDRIVFSNDINDDGSPRNDKVVFNPSEKIYLSIFIKNAEAEKTIVKMEYMFYLHRVTKYLTAKTNGDQWVSVDTGITDLFTIGDTKYKLQNIESTVEFSLINKIGNPIKITERNLIISDK